MAASLGMKPEIGFINFAKIVWIIATRGAGNKICPIPLIDMKKFLAFGLLALSFVHSPAGFGQTPLTSDEINAAEFVDSMPEGVSALTHRLQVHLNRAGANPGVIDVVAGEK